MGLDLAVVIVGFRRYDLLVSCLNAVIGSDIPPNQIIVIDNESNGSELQALIDDYDGVQFVGNASNRGFAAACNQGRRLASADHLLFLNPDVVVQPSTLSHCMEALHGSVGIVTCRLVLPDGSLDHACHRGFPTPLASFAYYLRLHRVFRHSRRFGRYTLDYLDPTVSHAIEACSGAFLLTPASLFDELGGWDEGYWFYGEDLDYCWRVTHRGYSVEYVADVEAIHDKSATSGKRRRWDTLTPYERSIRSRVQIEAARSHRRFFEKNVASETSLPVRVAVRVALTLQLATAMRNRR